MAFLLAELIHIFRLCICSFVDDCRQKLIKLRDFLLVQLIHMGRLFISSVVDNTYRHKLINKNVLFW